MVEYDRNPVVKAVMVCLFKLMGYRLMATGYNGNWVLSFHKGPYDQA